MYTSNGTLVHLPLGPIHTSIPDPRSQVVYQLSQRVDDQNNLIGQLLRQINLETNWQGRERDRASETQTSASCTLSRSTIHSRLRSQEARARELLHDERNDRRSLTCSRTNSPRQLMEESSQAQSTNLPHGQGNEGGQPLQVDEEVNHPCLNHDGRQWDQQGMRAEEVKKLVNDRLRNLKIGGNFEDALRREVDQANSTPFTIEIEQAAPPKRFSTPSFTHFKGDFDPESHLKHFKSIMIFYKANDVVMCKVFAMTLQGAAQDLFHSLPSGSISSFKELAHVFTKEYTSYRTIKKNPDHLFNLQKKDDESLRDYIKRFKAERANIIGCDDRIASSAFKRGLPIECELYRELTISPCQTLVEVFAIAERYALWDDDRTAAKKAADQPVELASRRNDMIKDKDGGKCRLYPQRGAPTAESYTKFTIPIQQILAQVKNMPWLKKPLPLKGNPTKKDTSRYCEFH
ncbi:unnamed protein product [Prunus brigantina]